jgi:branched-chain amino acid aminotransferase
MHTLVNLNGTIHRKDEVLLMATNRSFLYGDGIFETIKFTGSQLLWVEDHHERMIKSLNTLGIQIPQGFENSDGFKSSILEILEIGIPATVRATIWRGKDGLYMPELDGDSHFLIQSRPSKFSEYKWIPEPKIIGLLPNIIFSKNPLSGIKSTSASQYVFAARMKEKAIEDELILLNENNNFAEATMANIFLVKDGVFFTPPESEGGIPGILQKNIIRLLHKENWELSTTPLSEKNLYDADEVFLTNVVSGITPISSFNDKKFIHEWTEKLFNKIVNSI